LIENLVIISLDQAENTGYCISIGDEIVSYGSKNCNSNSGLPEDVLLNCNELLESFLEAYKDYPILVTIEDIYEGLSKKVFKQLSRLQGSLMLTLKGYLYEIIMPRRWKAKYEIKGGKDGKLRAIQLASEIIGVQIDNDNTADAILMNEYARKFIKVASLTL
jgi:hypothetical protein